MHAFTAPPLENYHENRKIEVSISKNIEELKLSSNRFKRYLAMKSLFTYGYGDILNFKYPMFSSIILFFIGFYLVFFSLFSLLFGLIFMFLIFFNPYINKRINDYILFYLLNEKEINKEYIEPKHISNNWV